MKVTTIKPEFTPVSITITFESREELDDFGCLCNSLPIVDNVMLPSYLEIEKLGANIDTGINDLLRKIKNHPAMKSI